METPVTLAGGKLLNCDLDETCMDLDCDEVMDEYADALLETSAGADFLAHYCGLEYLEKLQHPDDPE